MWARESWAVLGVIVERGQIKETATQKNYRFWYALARCCGASSPDRRAARSFLSVGDLHYVAYRLLDDLHNHRIRVYIFGDAYYNESNWLVRWPYQKRVA